MRHDIEECSLFPSHFIPHISSNTCYYFFLGSDSGRKKKNLNHSKSELLLLLFLAKMKLIRTQKNAPHYEIKVSVWAAT